MLNLLRRILKEIVELKEIIAGKKSEELTDLEKQYSEYKYFADSRGQKLLADSGLLDEYNSFMSECEKSLFGDERAIVLPKPSKELEAFKNRFNKFFK